MSDSVLTFVTILSLMGCVGSMVLLSGEPPTGVRRYIAGALVIAALACAACLAMH